MCKFSKGDFKVLEITKLLLSQISIWNSGKVTIARGKVCEMSGMRLVSLSEAAVSSDI